MNLLSAHLIQAFKSFQAKICPMDKENEIILIYSKVDQCSFILSILAGYYMQYILLQITLNFVRIYMFNPVFRYYFPVPKGEQNLVIEKYLFNLFGRLQLLIPGQSRSRNSGISGLEYFSKSRDNQDSKILGFEQIFQFRKVKKVLSNH